MNLYESIKNPLDDKKTLEKLISLYAEGNVFSSAMYSAIVKPDSEKDADYKEHFLEFNKHIESKAFAELYKVLKNIDPKKYDLRHQELMEQYKDNSELQAQICYSALYPYQKYKDLLEKYSAEELWKKYSRIRGAIEDYVSADIYRDNPKEYEYLYKKADEKYHLSHEDVELGKMVRRIMNRFDGGAGIMGFHVNPKNLGQDKRREQPEIKFYINAGSDTYKVARLFWEKCEEKDLNFYFKVADPTRREYTRADRMCIYSELEDVPEFLNILREIIAQNPDIKFKNPPLLVGKIDKWIGVGVDPKKSRESYNIMRARIIISAISEVFSKIDRKYMVEYTKRHPEILDVLRAKIIELGEKEDISAEKFCLENSVRATLEQVDMEEVRVSDKKSDTAKLPEEKQESDKKESKKSKQDNKEVERKSDKKDMSNESIEQQYKKIEGNLKSLITEMANDYSDGNYKKFFKQNREYRKLIKELVSLKIKNSGEKLNIFERALEMRRIDSFASSAITASKQMAIFRKMGDFKAVERYLEENNSSLKELAQYCIPGIEYKDDHESEKTKIQQEKKLRKEDPTAVTESEIEEYGKLIAKGYDVNSPEMIEFYKKVAMRKQASMNKVGARDEKGNLRFAPAIVKVEKQLPIKKEIGENR